MSDQPTERQNINDGPIEFDDYISMNRAALEVFFRSMLKPINDNETDAKGKNFIVSENFSFEPLKRLYFQDFYKSLLSTEKMYGMVKCDPVNDTWTNKTVVSNSVKIQGNTGIGDLNDAINNTVGAMDAVEIDESHFHSTIEFTENAGNRNVGLYDYGKLPEVNASGELFQLGLLEQVFREEEELFKEDIRREHNIVSYQTIARRLTELFARLSNIRFSMLFWTDKANNYSKQYAVAALDIFYNLMSRLSEAHRINISTETNYDALKYARAARLNKTYADMMRPCVFVPNLVSTMMMIAQSKMFKDEEHQDWTALLRKVTNTDDHDNFTWFGRTNSPSNKLFEQGLYVTSGKVNDDKLEALNQGGDYAESLTGIHLKCLNENITTQQIKDALTYGFEILADAFIECLNDGEVMKVLDMSASPSPSPPTPTNLPELMGSKGNTLGNVGDLQFSLILERIIAKVYKVLNMKSGSYFRGNIPRLNMDFALRFLTDSTIQNNELSKENSTKYRKAYSNVVDYVNRVNEWNDSTGQLDNDTDYTLNNVVTKLNSSEEGVMRIVNPSFTHMLEEWSLCPYRFNNDGSEVSGDGISETEVGSNPKESEGLQKLYGISYSKKAPACPFAETMAPSAGEQGESPCDRPHGCALHTFYEVPKDEVSNFVEKLKQIPPNCPARILVNGILKQLGEQEDIPQEDIPQEDTIPYENSSQYIHALFKAVDEKNKLIDTRNEESKSMGYWSSSAIYEHITYSGETAPQLPPPKTYKDEVHSNVRLVYLDQLIRLCQDLFRVNMDIAFEEPYLKTNIENIAQHYYGTRTHGSFEPITCYRFSNFHALNDQDTRSASKGNYQLKYYARTLDPERPQWVTAINRDLSGETKFSSDSIWERSDVLDNERKVEGTTNIESEMTYPSFNSNEILQGVIEHNCTSICRSNAHIHPFYQIHLMDEQINRISNQKQSLVTFEVYVKRFRPIYLPDADDLFMSEDRDPLDPTNERASMHATGWSMIPHKYSADAHFSKDAIIIPMNFGSRNSPRCGWFNELDYAFHKVVVQGDSAISGFYDETNDCVIEKKNIVGKEKADISKYHCRDWLWPAAMIGHCHVSGGNGALASIPDNIESIRTKDDNSDGANDYTQGEFGDVTIQDFKILEGNLKHFDLFKCADPNVDRSTALNANWLYITAPAPGGGVEISQCLFPLPWVFFHSSRGSQGADPPNYCHGLGDRVTTNHENGFSDGATNGMRFFAVDNVLSQSPVRMNLFGRSDVTLNDASAAAFIKGYYDPSCCGTDETWHTHGNGYYGWPNGGANKDGPRPDKYFLQYDNNGYNHVSAGQFLGSACNWASYYKYGSNRIERSPFAASNGIIVETLKGKPMTWSLWNVVRQSLYWCYNKTDYDYNKDRVGCAVDRTTMGASAEELEYKTGQSMRAMYKEWYQRFTYNGQYTSTASIDAGTAWPYKTHDDDPANYGQAQKLMNGNGTAMSGEPCKIEWTNLVADVSIIYNEVSDTHNSCLTFYTGGHPNYSSGYTDSASEEFKGPKGSEDSGVSSTQVKASWAGTDGYPDASNSIPFRYALSGVDMCRNFMAFTYRGYNSIVPDSAYSGGYPKFEPHHSHPRELAVSREISTANYNGNPISRSSSSADGTEFHDYNKLLRDIYPPTEQDDTEGCDSNFLQRLLVPIYPNWEDLHDSSGNPIYPDAVTDDDLKKIVFCVCPMTYYDGLADGNDGGAQMGERMFAFCISQFFMGVDAERLTSNLDTEFFAEIAKPNVSVIAPNLGHDYKPGDPAWGQGLVYAGNWDPSKWWRLS